VRCARSRQRWQQGHAAYFARNGGFTPEMELVCERFVMVEDLGVREVEEV
jgi:uncharacterized protein YhfF